MPNDYFRFKQFLINQDKCAMKVCTDSCILGAYADVATAANILDIGTGTGLLALMAAQRSEAQITAVEINKLASEQAAANSAVTPWADRIGIINASLQEFGEVNTTVFDVILCNPPFYKASHKSPDAARNVAMHSHDLLFEEIIQFCRKFLAPEGKLWILLPPAESQLFSELATVENLFVTETLIVYTSVAGKHIRTIQALSLKRPINIRENTLSIRQTDGSYTPGFTQLLQNYYLIF